MRGDGSLTGRAAVLVVALVRMAMAVVDSYVQSMGLFSGEKRKRKLLSRVAGFPDICEFLRLVIRAFN